MARSRKIIFKSIRDFGALRGAKIRLIYKARESVAFPCLTYEPGPTKGRADYKDSYFTFTIIFFLPSVSISTIHTLLQEAQMARSRKIIFKSIRDFGALRGAKIRLICKARESAAFPYLTYEPGPTKGRADYKG